MEKTDSYNFENKIPSNRRDELRLPSSEEDGKPSRFTRQLGPGIPFSLSQARLHQLLSEDVVSF